MEALMRYSWPGNVRELANVLERAQILAEEHTITPDDLPDNLLSYSPDSDQGVSDVANLHQTQRRHVLAVLKDAHGNKVHAARALGISRRALYRLLDKYHIRSDDRPERP
jgi:DNA-binding NtrC family response regulator